LDCCLEGVYEVVHIHELAVDDDIDSCCCFACALAFLGRKGMMASIAYHYGTELLQNKLNYNGAANEFELRSL
jgi:hypothetical protein